MTSHKKRKIKQEDQEDEQQQYNHKKKDIYVTNIGKIYICRTQIESFNSSTHAHVCYFLVQSVLPSVIVLFV